jgi:hypothetical protein
MSRKLLALVLLFSFAFSGLARGDDYADEDKIEKKKAERVAYYLRSEASRVLAPAKTIVIYDDCVNAGLIDGGAVSAEVKFNAYIDKEKKRADPARPMEVTDDQIAEAMHKSFNDVKEKLQKNITKMNGMYCDMINKHWSNFSKRYDLD